jgi:hypothetical protein
MGDPQKAGAHFQNLKNRTDNSACGSVRSGTIGPSAR